MSIEITVTVKDPDRTLKRDFLVYETVTLDDHDPILMKCVNDTVEEFKGNQDEITDIKVRTLMIFK